MADFYPVRVNTFRKNEKVLFDVYITVGEKYLHYIRDQDEFEENRINKLKQMGIRKLYIPSEQEQKYLNYLEAVLDSLADSGTNVEERAQMAHDTLVTSAENAVRNLDTEEGMQQQQRQMAKIADFIGSDPAIIRQIMSSVNNEMDKNQHAANVASLCMSVAQALGLKNGSELSDLSIAALVHDIGKQRFKQDYDQLPKPLQGDQRIAFRAHVMDGVAMLEGKPFINARILGLVASHEELGRGKGYPEKKDTFKLPHVYQILIMCNLFDEFQTTSKTKSAEAVAAFGAKHNEDFHPQLLDALRAVLG